MALLIIILLIACFIGLVFWIKHLIFVKNMMWHFNHVNVIVAGKKGTGKDLLFQYVVNHQKKDYYANISYSDKKDKRFHKLDDLKSVSVEPNDYNHIVNGEIEKIPHQFKEDSNIFISDIGVFLPSYMDSTLYKKFPSMPIIYALSRHLYNMNIHCNTQNIERGWKALREQADFYIICKRTYKIFGLFLTKIITYDKYESAKMGLLPMKSSLLNKYDKANVKLFNAQNGDIRKGWIIQLKSKLKYDTRAFEKILLKGKRIY